MNTKRAPKVRFKGFTDAWEQRKLEALVDVCSGRDYKHLTEGDIPVYGTGGYMLSVSEALSYDKDAIGIGRKGTIDKPYILNAPFWTVDTLFYAIPKEKVDLNFAFAIFQNINWKKKDESTGVPSLSRTAINEIHILVPQYDEQQALGQLFYGIDRLITLHQRKLDKIKDMRKAFLNLIFSQKLRFCGSNQSWRKLKIEDCFSERVERSEKGELISVTVNFGIVKAHSLARKDNSSKNKSHYKIVRKDDIAYNSMRMWQGASGISLYEGILSPAYTVIVPKQGISSLFFSYEFKLKKMLQTFQVNSQGLTSDTWNLKFPLLKNIVVEVPEYEEQEKVGIFFKKLDNLITLHQEKINQLTKLKTTFLKNMFI